MLVATSCVLDEDTLRLGTFLPIAWGTAGDAVALPGDQSHVLVEGERPFDRLA